MVHTLESPLTLFAIFLILYLENISSHSIPSQNTHNYEEYEIEHEISMAKAKANISALNIDLRSGEYERKNVFIATKY